MKANEYKDKSVEELNTEMLALMREQFNLRIQKGSGNISKPDRFKKVRRLIAKIKTILGQKGSNV